jgi:transcriptional regulator with XRE-family HTH domain
MRSLATAMSDILRGIAAKQRVAPAELAQRTGYHKSKINRLLNGKTVMGIDDADLISYALGVDLQDVLAEAMAETSGRPRKSTPDDRLRSI